MRRSARHPPSPTADPAPSAKRPKIVHDDNTADHSEEMPDSTPTDAKPSNGTDTTAPESADDAPIVAVQNTPNVHAPLPISIYNTSGATVVFLRLDTLSADTQERLQKLEDGKGSPNLSNVLNVKPTSFFLNSGRVQRKATSSPHHFFIVGAVADSSLQQPNRAGFYSVTIAPSVRRWDSLKNTLGAIFGDALVHLPFNSYGGSGAYLQFTTRRPAGGSPSKSSNNPPPLTPAQQVVGGVRTSDARYPVPVLDGTDGFRIRDPASLDALPFLHDELSRNDIAVIIFTVSTWNYGNDTAHPTRTSLNILKAIKVAGGNEEGDTDDSDVLPDPDEVF